MAKLTQYLKGIASDKLSKGIFWLGSAQVIGRIVRLGSSIIIARLLTPEVFGQVAIILTCFELIHTPTKRISSAMLIAMSETKFTAHLASANRLNWLACIAAFFIMALVSFPIASYYQQPLVLPMIVMASSYLLLPFGMLHAAKNLKDNNMRVVGSAVLWQTIFDSLLTGLLAILGFGIWAIIVPKVLVVFVWVFIHRRATNIELSHQIKNRSLANLARPGLQVGLADLSIALRQNIDYLLVGYLLGVEALGVYFFAFNASLGISLGLVQSYGTALYSNLCEAPIEQRSQQYINSLKLIFVFALPIIGLQAILAPLYVPLVYGEQWVNAGALPIFILLCLSGLFRPLGEATSQLLISIGRSQLNLFYNVGFTAALTIAIVIASYFGLTMIALAILLIHLIGMPIFSFYIYRTLKQRASKNYLKSPQEARYEY
ncbi:oligosaccharide flippase family protein [Shewanella waksmanii]|uniref:oligosaccharide flippase family protein n=1 Tax=Shewanella waksmanii TaxID=213783 RepID=UPI0037353FCD